MNVSEQLLDAAANNTSAQVAAYLRGLGVRFEIEQGNDEHGSFDIYRLPVCPIKKRECGDRSYIIASANGISAGCHGGKCEGKGWTDFQAAFGRPFAQHVPQKKPTYNIISMSQFATTRYTVNYLIDGLLVEGQPALLGGPIKSLKTSIACDIALGLASGTAVLGKFRAKRTPVLLMSGESGASCIQGTLFRIAEANGLNLATLDNLFFSEDLPRFNEPAHLEALADEMPKNGVIIIDPLYLSLGTPDPGNIFAMGPLLANLRDVCRATNTTPILCHHARKNVGKKDPFGVPELNDLSWSGTPEFARQWILLNRREAFEPGSGLHKLWFTFGGSAGHSGVYALDVDEGRPEDGRTWDVTLRLPSEMREAAKVERDAKEKENILGVLRHHPSGETETAIAAGAQVGKSRVKALLQCLVADKAIVPCTFTKRGREETGFKLAS